MTFPSEIIIGGYAFPAVVLVDPITGQPVPVTSVVPTSGNVAIPGGVAILGAVAVSGIATPVAIDGTVPVSIAAHVIADAGSTFPVAGTVAIAGTVPVSVSTPAPVNAAATPTMPFSLIDPITGLLTSAIRDYMIEVGFFSNTGAYAGQRRVTSLGNNPDIDTATTPEDIWTGGGAYPWMTGATSLEVVCASASDTSAGTGARTISIAGLKADYTELSQTITLNGVTPVAVPTQLFRINQVVMLTAGSGKVNAGDITVRDAGAGTTRAIIPTGYGISRQSIFTVPAGFTLQIVSQIFSINRVAAAAHATIANFIQTGLATAYRMPFEIGISDAVPYRHDGAPGVTLAEKTDFCYRCTSVSGNNTDVTAGFLGVMRQNGLT